MAILSKDTVAKQLMGRSDIFASVFNYFLYGGRKVIKPEELKEVPTEQLYYRGFNEAKRHRDLLKIAELRESRHVRFLFLGIENQSKIDPYMVLRIFLYDALSYMAQVEKAKGKRRRKLIPTITVIFNCSGRPWKKKLSLYDLLDIPRELKEFFEAYCGNHTIYVLNPYSMDEVELEKLEMDLMLVTKGLKYHNNEDRYYSFLQSEEMDSVADIVFDSIKVFNKDYDLEVIRNEEGRIDMCKASEGIKNSARAEAVMAAMENFGITVEVAMDGLRIPEKDRADILARIKKHA